MQGREVSDVPNSLTPPALDRPNARIGHCGAHGWAMFPVALGLFWIAVAGAIIGSDTPGRPCSANRVTSSAWISLGVGIMVPLPIRSGGRRRRAPPRCAQAVPTDRSGPVARRRSLHT